MHLAGPERTSQRATMPGLMVGYGEASAHQSAILLVRTKPAPDMDRTTRRVDRRSINTLNVPDVPLDRRTEGRQRLAIADGPAPPERPAYRQDRRSDGSRRIFYCRLYLVHSGGTGRRRCPRMIRGSDAASPRRQTLCFPIWNI